MNESWMNFFCQHFWNLTPQIAWNFVYRQFWGQRIKHSNYQMTYKTLTIKIYYRKTKSFLTMKDDI